MPIILCAGAAAPSSHAPYLQSYRLSASVAFVDKPMTMAADHWTAWHYGQPQRTTIAHGVEHLAH